MAESVPKRLVKLGISGVVGAGDWIARRLGGGRARHVGVALLYHDVSTDERENFANQMRFVQKHARLVSLDELPDKPTGAWHVAVTFDDALSSFGHVATPVCQSLGVPVTLFVPPGLLGSAGYMTTGELTELPDLVEIGSHSHLHRRLSVLSDNDLAEELTQSRQQLQSLSGKPIRRLAYPFGDWDRRVADATRAAEYEFAYTVRPSSVGSGNEALGIPRVTVEPGDWDVEFRLKVFGAYRWMGAVMGLRQRYLGASV
jgi:peptidoglycan/xylan/chitin deacetylase (PgdA/CDA1 family)